MALKVLFLTSSEEDYLADGLLLGLREIYGSDCIDYPRKDILYEDCSAEIRQRLYGRGFTLYSGMLQEEYIDRHRIRQKLAQKFFDLVVVSNIWRLFGSFVQWRPWLTAENTVLIDGEDTSQVYPHAGFWWRRTYYWNQPSTAGFLYFKREWTDRTRFNLWHRLLPAAARRLWPFDRRLRRISFSIPGEKVVGAPAEKSKLFSRHVVDPEVAAKLPESLISYAFTDEREYYADLRSSRFGITTRRSGWDCLRHYEIAANGCVPCFRDLRSKPDTCAPHGLVPGVNCLDYRDAGHLLDLTRTISSERHKGLATGAVKWARENTTRQVAMQMIEAWRRSRVAKAS